MKKRVWPYKDWDYQKNVLDPSALGPGSSRTAFWICPECGKSYEAPISSHCDHSLCHECSVKRRMEKRLANRLAKGDDLVSKCPELAKEFLASKNEISPEKVLFGSHSQYWWKCPKCGLEYQNSPSNRILQKQGCPKCARKEVGRKAMARTVARRGSVADCADKIDAIFLEDRNGVKASEVPSTGKTSYWWQCKYCGRIYKNTPKNKCFLHQECFCHAKEKWREKTIASRLIPGKTLADLYPDLLNEWDYAKNKMKPDEIMPQSKQKVWWLCENGHSFQRSPADRMAARYACPICARQVHTSFPEQAVFFYFKEAFPDAVSRWNDGDHEIDCYVPSEKAGIEFDGIRYHAANKRDLRKTAHFAAKGIRIFRIKEGASNAVSNADVSFDYRSGYLGNLSWAISQMLSLFRAKSLSIDCERDCVAIYKRFVRLTVDGSVSKTNQEILPYWDSERNGLLKPTMFSAGSKRIVFWKCPKCGHSFKRSIQLMVKDLKAERGNPCEVCRGDVLVEGTNDLSTIYPELMKRWDSGRNGIPPSKTTLRMVGDRKVWWICEKGHHYKRRVYEEIKLNGRCPVCMGKHVVSGFNDLATLRPDLLEHWDYERNLIKPTEISPHSHRKVHWVSSNGHHYIRSADAESHRRKKHPTEKSSKDRG
jgi:hypothetical protein